MTGGQVTAIYMTVICVLFSAALIVADWKGGRRP